MLELLYFIVLAIILLDAFRLFLSGGRLSDGIVFALLFVLTVCYGITCVQDKGKKAVGWIIIICSLTYAISQMIFPLLLVDKVQKFHLIYGGLYLLILSPLIIRGGALVFFRDSDITG
ncbi:hypothetical protein ACTL6P_24325 [Endozoicomonas acroporae]|uniref:hypothetical protein n=1 Tax=Endozoicomonas acroporae TaxID=1701104 RepID=UPI0015E094D0|nr:hypothetical protein [Endozoicomonas acroporae]